MCLYDSLSSLVLPGYLPLEMDDPEGMVDANYMSSQSGGQRQKRVRTSFKHHQLKTMKMYFSYNHNPDAKDLKQLAQKTGLSKRVLQVRQRATADSGNLTVALSRWTAHVANAQQTVP